MSLPLGPARDGALVLFLTRQCNIECDHCIVDSGPRRRGVLDPAAAMAAIDGAAAAGLRTLVFSGGESLLHAEPLARLCLHARDRGLRTRVFSNGWWGRSVAEAQAMLERLVADGVDELVVSLDSYHLPWVPAERLRNIVAATASAATTPFVYYQMVVPPPVDAAPAGGLPPAVAAELAAYGLPAARALAFAAVDGWCRASGLSVAAALEVLTRERLVVQWLPLFVGGRAQRRLPTLALRRPLALAPGEGCASAGRQITVASDGAVFPCCSSWSSADAHRLGRVGPEDGAAGFAELTRRIADDPLVLAIHRLGPGRLLAALRDAGHAVTGSYSDICNMCEDLLRRFTREQLLAAAAELHARMVLDWLMQPTHPEAP